MSGQAAENRRGSVSGCEMAYAEAMLGKREAGDVDAAMPRCRDAAMVEKGRYCGSVRQKVLRAHEADMSMSMDDRRALHWSAARAARRRGRTEWLFWRS